MTGCDKYGEIDRVDLDSGVRRGRMALVAHTQAEMRSMAIRMYRQAGKPMDEIAGAFGVSLPTIYRWARVPVPCLSEALSDFPSPRD